MAAHWKPLRTNPAEGKRSGGTGSLSSGDPERIRWDGTSFPSTGNFMAGNPHSCGNTRQSESFFESSMTTLSF